MNSDQLRLELRLPWDGYSPRSLTKAAERFTFQAGMGRLNRVLIPFEEAVQLELFPEGTHYGS